MIIIRTTFSQLSQFGSNSFKQHGIPLQVDSTPVFAIVTQPKSVTVTAGENAIITVEASGEGLTYQWYTMNSNQSRFYKSSVTTNIYSVTTTLKMSGRKLYCVITDANGETLTTDTVTMTVVEGG